MKLSKLLCETGIKCPQDISSTAEETEITGLALDSRKVKKGDLFVCLTGEHTDGHIYAAEAVWMGAAAVLAQEPMGSRPFPVIPVPDTREALWRLAKVFYGDPAADMVIFGVTGTNGKTTVTHMLQAIYQTAGIDCGIIGTVGYRVGGDASVRPAERTTPEALDLFFLLSEMKKNGSSYCAMEVSSHGLALARVKGISFAASIFTNLTEDHLDYHKDMEDYYRAKKKLFEMTDGAAVINVDDGYGARLYRELKERGKPVAGCSLTDPAADFYGEIRETSAAGTRFELLKPCRTPLCSVQLPVPGRFNVENAILAMTCAVLNGVEPETAAAGLAAFHGAPGRFELVGNDRDITIIIDYAHTPDALENVLVTAKSFTRGRLYTVFGCGGDRDAGKRPLMGRIAGTYSDHSIITSDNPRTEDQKTIAAQIEAGFREIFQGGTASYEIINGRREAIRRALAMCRPGDVLLIAGKGHETSQIIGGSRNYFSDKDTVKGILADQKSRKEDCACEKKPI